MWNITLIAVALYAITGGPAVGKTSIIEALQEKGEIIVKESAIDLIIEDQANGVAEPWKEEGFEIKLFEEKLKREKKALQEASFGGSQRVFADRGLLDTVAYLSFHHKENTKEGQYIFQALERLQGNHQYGAVFYVEPYNGSHFVKEVTKARFENTEESLKIAKLTKEAYSKWKVPIITVPSGMTPKERAEFVLHEIHKLEATKGCP